MFLDPQATVGVRAFCNYAASNNWQGPKFTSADFRGRFFVNAMKGDPSKLGNQFENFNLGPGGTLLRVDRTNFDLLVRGWAKWAALRIREKGFERPVVLAPLPTSKATPALENYRTLYLAGLVREALGGNAVVWAGARFRRERISVHAGGNRATIPEDMMLTSLPPAGEIVPLDDVYTQGSHLSALMTHLDRDRWPRFMVCGGKTIWDTPEKRDPDEFPHSHYG